MINSPISFRSTPVTTDEIYREALTITNGIVKEIQESLPVLPDIFEKFGQLPNRPIITYSVKRNPQGNYKSTPAEYSFCWGSGHEAMIEILEQRIASQMVAFLSEDHRAPTDVARIVAEQKIRQVYQKNGFYDFLRRDFAQEGDPIFLQTFRDTAKLFAVMDKIKKDVETETEKMARQKIFRSMFNVQNETTINIEDWAQHIYSVISEGIRKSRLVLHAMDGGWEIESEAEKIEKIEISPALVRVPAVEILAPAKSSEAQESREHGVAHKPV